jgi:hypothetical protein
MIMVSLFKSAFAQRFIGGFVLGAAALLALPGVHL